MSDDHIEHADPKEGYDHAEPAAGAIVAFAIGSLILLVLMIIAVQMYFDKIWKEAVYEKILAPPSQQLIDLHNRENWNLTHYGYFDKPTGQVRIPVDKAMELFAQEAGAGKLFYPAKGYVPKKEEPVAALPPPATGPGAPAPDTAPPAPNTPPAPNK
jgi:hypothetical protein